MSGSQLAQWWNDFYSSFSSVSSFFFDKVFRSIADILLDSKIIVFTAVFFACAAVSAVVYIILNSRSDNFDDGYLNSCISTPDMYSSFPTDITMFGYSGYKRFSKRKSKKEAEANRIAAEEARERDRAEAEGFANEYFEHNQTRMTVSYNGFKFYAPNWYKRNWGNTHKIRTTQYRDRHGNLQVRTSDTVTKDESNEFEQIED